MGLMILYRYGSNRPNSVAMRLPIGFFGLASTGKPIPNGLLCYTNASSELAGRFVA
jgi:hypothetical protein